MIGVSEFLKDEKILCSNNLISTPVVSVIMPTYCRGNNGLLERAIRSVLSQSYDKLELIIVDDGSVDRTQQVVKQFMESDNRVIYIRNESNSGLPAIRVNQGIAQARGKYICYQFDDDEWLEDALISLVDEIDKYKVPVVVYGAWKVTDKLHGNTFIHEHEFQYDKLIEDNYIANSTVIHPKELCEKCGMYDMHMGMRRLCDWDLWLRYGKVVPFIFINKVISHVTMYEEGSLGVTVTYDLSTSRMLMSRPRNDLLTLKNYEKYVVDDLSDFYDDYLKNYVYNQHILSWKIRHRNQLPWKSNFYSINEKKQRVIVSKLAYDATVIICVENYLNLCMEDYEFVYIPEGQLTYDFFIDGDILILQRGVLESTVQVLEALKANDRKVATLYFTDDNLLEMHKLSEELAYYAPGTVMYNATCRLITLCDRVVAFSQGIADAVKKYNNRITRLDDDIPEKYLSEDGSYEEQERFRIVFTGGGARKKEFEEIEEDLIKVLERYGERVQFVFWGYIPEKMKNLGAGVVEFIPYTSSYHEYLERLVHTKFNLLICPLDSDSFRDCKSPIKFIEMCCCSTIGLFSDTPVYQCIKHGYNGFKIKKGESWFDAISKIIELPYEDKKKIFDNALKTVKTHYTAEAQVETFRLALKAAQVHNMLNGKKILYFSHSGYLAGAENHLFRHAMLSQKAGLEIVFALPKAFENLEEALQVRLAREEIETVYLPTRNYVEIEDIDGETIENSGILHTLYNEFKEMNIGLIHVSTLMPEVALAARKLGIPCISSLYQTVSDYHAEISEKKYLPDFVHSDSVLYANLWQRKIGCKSLCIRSFIPPEFLSSINEKRKIGKRKRYNIAVSGTLQERKRQLEIIKTIALLKNVYELHLYIFGDTHFFKDYKKICDDTIKQSKLENCVHFMGFSDKIASDFEKYEIDMLVCGSNSESFPQVILEAMAMNIPVISTPVGGVPELIDETNGFLTSGFAPDNMAEGIQKCIAEIGDGSICVKLAKAKEDLLKECSEEMVSTNLFGIYSTCLKEKALIEDSILTARPVKVYGPLVNPEELCLSRLIKDRREYTVTLKAREISHVGIICTAFSALKGEIRIEVRMPGLIERKAVKRLEDIKFNEWSYFDIDFIEEYSGRAEIVVAVEYDRNSGEIGVYERKKNKTVIHRVKDRLHLKSKALDVLLVDFC